MLLTIIVWSNCNNKGEVMMAAFEVDGMSIKGGILWMGWPTDIGKALDGLKGIERHSFNIENWQFNVQYNSKIADKNRIIQTVEPVGNYRVKDWIIIGWISLLIKKYVLSFR